MDYKAFLLPLYAVATLFPRLLSLPILPEQIQLTELLFFPLLWAFRDQLRLLLRKWPLFTAAAAVYLLGNVLSALYSGSTAAILEAGGRVYLAIMVAITVAYLREYQPRVLTTIWKWFSIGLAGLSLIVYVWVALGGSDPFTLVARFPDYPYLGNVLRLRGTASVFGMFYMLLLPGLMLAYVDWRAGRAKLWQVMVILFACFATIGKENFLFPIGVLLFEAGKHHRYRWIMRGLAGACIAILMLGTHYLIHRTGQRLSEPGFSSGRIAVAIPGFEFEETNYTANKRAALLIGARNPWLGVGPGRFQDHTGELVATGDYPAHFGRFNPHSAWTGAFAETGAVGLMGLFALVAALWYYRPETWTVPAVILQLFLVASVFKDVMNFRGLWVVVGLYLAGNCNRKKGHRQEQ